MIQMGTILPAASEALDGIASLLGSAIDQGGASSDYSALYSAVNPKGRPAPVIAASQ